MTGRKQRCADDLGIIMMTLMVMMIVTRFVLIEFTLLLVFPEIVILSLFNVGTGWATKRKSRRLVLAVCTSALLTLQAGLAYDLQSYYQGEIYGPFWGESVDLPPGETYHSKSLSNWYTVRDLDLQLRDWSGNVTFYITDENIPQNKYEQGNYSQYCRFSLRLPYRYSYAFVVANWTINLYNPSQNESIYGFIGINVFITDGYFPMRAVLMCHGLPLIAILTLWVYTGFSMRLERSRRPASRAQVSEQPQDGGSSAAQEDSEQM